MMPVRQSNGFFSSQWTTTEVEMINITVYTDVERFTLELSCYLNQSLMQKFSDYTIQQVVSSLMNETFCFIVLAGLHDTA